MLYRQLRQGVNDAHYKLIPITDDVFNYIENTDKDYYLSIYEYNEEQFKRFKETGSIKGITDTTSSRLVWDFDSIEDLNLARQNTIDFCNKLVDVYKIPEDSLRISFSGQKGFCVLLETDKRFTVEEFKNITYNLASEYSTYDKVVNDSARILRITGTRHPKTGLYKFPISFNKLKNSSIDEIKLLAKDISNREQFNFASLDLPNNVLHLAKPKKKEQVVVAVSNQNIDFSKKVKGWTNCKWALAQGYGVKAGERHNQLLCVIATAKALNNTKEQAYYYAKNASEKGAELHGCEKHDKEELWNMVESVYVPSWQGGTFSCKDGKSLWLTDLCDTLGHNKCHISEIDVVDTSTTFNLFQNYAENYENNVIKTGIASLDEKCSFLVGTSNGILAPPGVGKSSASFGILNHNSKMGINSIFFSYDMYHSMVYLRLLQRHTGYKQEEIFDLFKSDKQKLLDAKAIIDEEYKKVKFCFKSGQTADEIYETILDTQDHTGEKVKLVIIDYNELVITNVSDPTQASAQVAQRLRQIANETDTCIITLLQPSKLFSNPSDEITTYQGAKGSGAIAQSMSLMLSLSRPGFHPRRPEEDNYFTINALKNRHGGLFTLDLGWNGVTGRIGELSQEEEYALNDLRARRAQEQKDDGGF